MYKLIAGFLLVTLLFSCSMKKEVLYKPVEKFELSKYLGTWYEIARFPHSFEKDLERVTATYSLNDNGTIKRRIQVINAIYPLLLINCKYT